VSASWCHSSAAGAIVAAVMTGDFIDQLTDVGAPLVHRSVMHVIG
jgi:hypothetical protein